MSARRKHRSSGVLLHEIGHTLGAIHEEDRTSLMFPMSNKDMRSYGANSAAVMRAGIVVRASPMTPERRSAWMRELLASYEKQTTGWNPVERDDMIKRLKAVVTPVAAAAPSASAKPATTDPGSVIPSLAEKDRATYEKGHALWKEGKVKEAWTTGEPLFEVYPKVFGVQDFRCQLASVAGFAMDRLRKECAQLMVLSTGK